MAPSWSVTDGGWSVGPEAGDEGGESVAIKSPPPIHRAEPPRSSANR
jgi:hypothetical protein